MAHLNNVVVGVCLVSGLAVAQSNPHLHGSDVLKNHTQMLLHALGLDDQLHYDGGGSGIGINDLIRAIPDCPWFVPCQTVAPSSRFVLQSEIDRAAAYGVRFVDHVIGLDGVVIHVNDEGNSYLTRMKFSDAQRIWRCQVSTWDQVPGSGRTDAIFVNALDEVSGTTDNFQSRVTGFNTSPPDSWWFNYPCVTVCRPGPNDNCPDFIASVTAAIPNAIGFTGLPGLRSGNRALALCNDTNPFGTCGDSDYVFPAVTTIRNGNYPLARQLHYYSADGAISPGGPQFDWLTAATTPDGISCNILQAQGFVSDGILCHYGF